MRPSEKELKKAIEKINADMVNTLKNKTAGAFKKIYRTSVDAIEKELNINILTEKIDENAIGVLATDKVLSQAYKGISNTATVKIKKIIEEAYHNPEGLSSTKIVDMIKEAGEVTESQANNIARTETSKVSVAARKNSYQKFDPEGNNVYKWIGPDDDRTTGVSKRIKSRTVKGVTWDELVKIIGEESSKDFPEWTVDKEAPVSHYQSRHSFIRVVSPQTL